jgi:hypothetical protein
MKLTVATYPQAFISKTGTDCCKASCRNEEGTIIQVIAFKLVAHQLVACNIGTVIICEGKFSNKSGYEESFTISKIKGEEKEPSSKDNKEPVKETLEEYKKRINSDILYHAKLGLIPVIDKHEGEKGNLFLRYEKREDCLLVDGKYWHPAYFARCNLGAKETSDRYMNWSRATGNIPGKTPFDIRSYKAFKAQLNADALLAYEDRKSLLGTMKQVESCESIEIIDIDSVPF